MGRFITFLLGSLLLTACATQKRCEQRYGPCGHIDTVVVVRTDTNWHYLPGDTVRESLRIDSLIYLTDTVIRQDTDARARLTYWRDAYNRLQLHCEAMPDTVFSVDTVRTQGVVKTRAVKVDVTPWWAYLVLVCGLLAMVVGIIALLRR